MNTARGAWCGVRGAGLAFGVAACVVLTAGAAHAGDTPAKKKIMLVSFSSAAVPAAELRSIETLACGELARHRGYDVVCPEDVNAVLKEQQLKMGLGACPDGDCMNAAGKLMDSDFTVTGAIEEKDGKWMFTIAIVETAGQKPRAKASAETAQNVDKIAAKIKPLVADLYKNLSNLPAAAKPPPDKPAPAPREKQ